MTTGKMKGSRKSPISGERKLYIEFLGIRIATVTLERIEAIAGKSGQTVSEVVRGLLERGLRRIK